MNSIHIPEQQLKFTTDCQGCPFRIANTIYQTGCFVQDVSNDDYYVETDEFGQEYYKFTEKICQYKRDSRWKKPNETYEEMYKRVRQEVRINVCLCYNVRNLSKDEIVHFIPQTFKHHGMGPRRYIYVCLPNQETTIYDIVKPLGHQFKTLVIFNDETWREECFKLVKHHFYCFVNAPQILHPRLIGSLDKQINDHNFRFTLLANEDNSVALISKTLYDIQPLPLIPFFEEIKENSKDFVDYDYFTKNI